MNLEQTVHAVDIFGVAVFAVSGSLAAGRKRMDIFGVIVLGMVTSLGGGTLRDIILNVGPVFWVGNPSYLLVAAIASVSTFIAVRGVRIHPMGMLVSDAFGLAVFTVIGAEKALNVTHSVAVAVVMGVMTGVAGGIIRDVLSAEVPLILRKEIYATASLCGALVYVVMRGFEFGPAKCLVVSVPVTLLIRLAAIRWNLSLPVFSSRDDGTRSE